ncbi:Acg family FMN-binding oxidoreductase [Paractinoplanes durhamensis]|uniref:NAD(P)H nitroreductase n=1 Tax=Paractinoplanes durhamensis TaxID=113563 RepID=A0ABQ3YRL3_9ACTN|nr:nitroreductase family protein [Actinoplanes durhamensis]GIE00227.1 NAD(P)H nitroreductase [Actinoplanes durhamensis]
MDTTTVPPSRKVLAGCVGTATAAPSLHNSQPWRFRIDGPSVDVYADPARRLHVIDPAGRELLISVGAAVFTLRLAITLAGYRCECEPFPSPADPDLVARVTAGKPTAPSAAAEALFAAVPHRHTNRWPFAHTAVPADALEHLVNAARLEGAALSVASPPAREAILGLALEADRRLRARPGYRDELRRWAGPSARHDGVPTWAIGPWDALESMPIRDLGALSDLPRPTAKFEPYPTILVLATDGDEPADWLRAGQALQRVLLTATWENLATTPISQPIEVPAVREALAAPDGRRFVQSVLRIGYGKITGRTGRRPVADVLMPERRGAT